MSSPSNRPWGPESVAYLLQGFEDKIDSTQSRLAYAEGMEKIELQEQVNKMKEELEKLKESVTTEGELREAILDLERDNDLLDRIEHLSLDQVDLDLIINSDLGVFLDKNFLKKLEEDRVKMQFSDSIKSILGKEDHEIQAEAVSEWSEHVREIDREISRIQASGGSGPLGIGLIPHLEAEKQDGKDAWIRRRIKDKKIEKSKQIKLLNKDTDATVIGNLKEAFLEARSIRLDKIYAFIETRAQITRGHFELLAKQSAEIGSPSNEMVQSLAEQLEQAEELYLGRSITDPKELRNIAKSFMDADRTIKSIKDQSREGHTKNAEIKSNILKKNERFKEALEKLKSLGIPEIGEAEVVDTPEGPLKMEANHRKNLASLAALKDIDRDTIARVKEIEKEVENINSLEAFDLVELNTRLETATRQFTDKVDAYRAGATIEALDTVNTAEEIEAMLLKELGENHLMFIETTAEFQDKYKDYTVSGDMVFYERGDEWAIIMNREALHKPGADIDFFKKQIRHELLHLEFEKDSNKKEEVRNTLIMGNLAQWEEIKKAFMDMVNDPAHPKKAPTKEGWRDDDILSEIYAMQNDMGNQWSDKDTTKARLNNLLLASGAANQLRDLKSKTESYEKESPIDPIIRGFEDNDSDDTQNMPKQGETINHTEGSYQKFQEAIDGNTRRLADARKAPQLNSISGASELVAVMSTYNDQTSELNRHMLNAEDKSVISAAISARIKKIGEDLLAIESAISSVAKGEDNTSMGFLRRSLNNTQFLSISAVVQLGTDVKEFLARALKRRNADQAARLGVALFGATSLGRESKARALQAESDEVGEWEKRYKSMDPWQLLGELKGLANSGISPNKDQMKAVMRLLAEKGRINWQNQDLWLALNKLQSSSHFPLGDANLLKDPVLLRERMLRAFGEIYDYDEFPGLERSNEDKYDGGKKQFEKTHDLIPTKMTERLDEQLKIKNEGGKVDPIFYESMLEDCMTKGRSYGENVMFHLIAGMGSGILTPDRGLALASKLSNNWPPIEWFGTINPPPTQQYWHNLCQTHFKDAYKSGSLSKKEHGKAFKSWFWSTIQMNKAVIQRAKKAVGNRNYDHDWSRTISCLSDVDMIQRYFSGRGGQKELQITAVGNTVAGMLQLLEENAKNQTNADRNEFARIASIMAMTEGILNSTYKGEDGTITRATPEINDDAPREAGVGHHNGLSTKGHRNINVSFLKAIDRPFFTMLENLGELKEKRDQQSAGQEAARYLLNTYPSLATEISLEMDINQIYDRIGRVTQVMFQRMDEGEFQGILRRFAAK